MYKNYFYLDFPLWNPYLKVHFLIGLIQCDTKETK